MTKDTDKKHDRLLNDLRERLIQGQRVRRLLPQGRIHIDRQLPFLCIYRSPRDREDALTEFLVVGEASYIITTGAMEYAHKLEGVVEQVVQTLGEEFGDFLLIEVWSSADEGRMLARGPGVSSPVFNLYSSAHEFSPMGKVMSKFEQALKRIKIAKKNPEVVTHFQKNVTPPGLKPLLTSRKLRQLACQVIGLEVSPIYRDCTSDKKFPLVFRALQRGMTRAFKQIFFEFVQTHTTHRPKNYQALGRRAVVKAVWEVDQQLAKLSAQVPFLLQVTPMNTDVLWRNFRRKQYECVPTFYYRPLLVEPDQLKRRLWQIHIERLEDPTIEALFREKRAELDVQFTMLSNIDSRVFRYCSLQLFGGIDRALLMVAREILDELPRRSRDELMKNSLSADQFKQCALEEIQYYRKRCPQFLAEVHVRDDVASGLMVSENKLFIGAKTRIPKSRVRALLQHEIGVHLLTYFNGTMQPFKQLCFGLAGYDELQEGLAVLWEYLVGGLSRPRLRVLAARVVACGAMLKGASFVETYRELVARYGFEKYTAFVITVRVYRGGGFVKDAVYLRGLLHVMDYLEHEGDLTPLFLGKIGTQHIKIIKELQSRKVLHETSLQPRFIQDEMVLKRLGRLRKGLHVKDLAERVIK